MWTRFMDMHSGGGTKEPPYEYIYIEASEKDAETIFYNRFGHNPNRVTCTCCGNDYSISEGESLKEITAYERNCEYKNGTYVEETAKSKLEIRATCKTKESDKWGLYVSLDEYAQQKDVLVIYDKDIKQEERIGEIPEQGYVWVD